MNDRRPARVLAVLALSAVVLFAVSALSDDHAGWDSPRQVVANVTWIGFLLVVLALVVSVVRLLVRRSSSDAA